MSTSKTLPHRAAHTYIAYIRECPPPGGGHTPCTSSWRSPGPLVTLRDLPINCFWRWVFARWCRCGLLVRVVIASVPRWHFLSLLLFLPFLAPATQARGYDVALLSKHHEFFFWGRHNRPIWDQETKHTLSQTKVIKVYYPTLLKCSFRRHPLASYQPKKLY